MFNKFNGMSGYFSDEKVVFIRTSHITGYIENPFGTFQCENINCDNDWVRYKPLLNQNIPDILPCPVCKKNMLHHGLDILWSESLAPIRNGSNGTPEIYQSAIYGCDVFRRYCKALLMVNPEDTISSVNQIPSFDVILDIAPVIFDYKSISVLKNLINEFKFENYQESLIENALKRLSYYEEFYENLSTNKTYKQTDLKNTMDEKYIMQGDPTWIFYIWSNFNFFRREKIKNRIYLTTWIVK